MRAKPIVAIDGPAGAGKSTVAKLAARALNYMYIDTGAMYRAVTYYAMRQGLDLADAKTIEAAAASLALDFPPGKPGAILINGRLVTEEIRTPEVSRMVSAHVANYPGVRRAMVAQQQALGRQGGVVMEGRDITSVVFPDAELKVFLTASQEERARRRHAELSAKGMTQPLAEVLADLLRRDLEDAQRPGGALIQTPDARPLETTGLTVDQVVATIVAWAHAQERPQP
jgi:cytidylate kinase